MATIDSDNYQIMQWNAQGIAGKKDEVLDYISKYKIDIIAIQETKLFGDREIKIPKYNIEKLDGHWNRMAHGGLATYVHNEIPYKRIPINVPMQALAIRVQLSSLITICNVYSPRSHQLSEQILEDLLAQLPSPVLILGDFNAYHELWGDRAADARGNVIHSFLMTNNLNILNSGQSTRISYGTESAIDLTICSPILQSELVWSALSSPGSSDHCPIITTVLCPNRTDNSSETWKMSEAQWDQYSRNPVWNNLPNLNRMDENSAIEDFYTRIETACNASIPRTRNGRFYPKPWWCDRVKNSRNRREIYYQRYRHNRTPYNIIQWKKARAEHKVLTKNMKQESFIQYTETINVSTPMNKIYETFRKIQGKSPNKVHILHENEQMYTTIPEIANKLAEAFSSVSSSNNYPLQFISKKNQIEAHPISIPSNDNEVYNTKFTLSELQRCLAHVKANAPGPDPI